VVTSVLILLRYKNKVEVLSYTRTTDGCSGNLHKLVWNVGQSAHYQIDKYLWNVVRTQYCDAEMVLKFLSVEVNGWTMRTLKGDRCEADGAKIWSGYSSSRIVDAKSWCIVFFLVFWVFHLFAGLYLIFALQSNWTAKLVMEPVHSCFWWVLEWKCGSRSWGLVGVADLVKVGEDWAGTYNKGMLVFDWGQGVQ